MKPNKRAKNARKQISDIYLEVVKLSDFLSELQLQPERESVKSDDSHELADEYMSLFQGCVTASDQSRYLGGKIHVLVEVSP